MAPPPFEVVGSWVVSEESKSKKSTRSTTQDPSSISISGADFLVAGGMVKV
jgi:hypothetical protein